MAILPVSLRPVWICGFALLTAALSAQMPRSVTYSFDYAVTGMGGGISTSNDYSLVAISDDNGLASPSISTGNFYQIVPAIGTETSESSPARVEMWSLYQ